MSVGDPVKRIARRPEGGDKIKSLVRCLLSHYNRISVSRIHKLAFVAEWKYVSGNGRLTTAEYYRVSDGCRSDHISWAIEDINGLKKESVKVGRESVDTIIRESDLECDLEDGEGKGKIENVVEGYGDIPKESMNDAVMSIPEYQDTKLGEKILF